MDKKMTLEKAFRMFSYDPDTGIFIRKDFIEEDYTPAVYSRLVSKFVGKEAGHDKSFKNGMMYKVITYLGHQYRGHHVAWLMCKGRWPEKGIDHIDGNGLNNQISNLREVDQAENTRNRRKGVVTKSGVMGVYWNNKNGKWFSKIVYNGVQKQIYYGDSLDEAIRIRKKWERRMGYHENHGRK